MRPRAQDQIDQRRGIIADGRGLAENSLMRPVAVAPVRTWHMFGGGGRPMRTQAAKMCGDQLAAVENLYRAGGDARLHLFTEQPERHRIKMLLDLDVIVEVHPAFFPRSKFIGCRRQRPQRGAVELFE
jgi:hypothetical protein